MQHEQDNIIKLRVFNDIIEAMAARERLTEAGIDSFLEDENVVGLNPLGGIKLKIFIKDKAEAENILSQLNEGHSENSEIMDE